jgi:hypothetical protein
MDAAQNTEFLQLSSSTRKSHAVFLAAHCHELPKVPDTAQKCLTLPEIT